MPRVVALVVGGGGLATGAIGRLGGELLLVAGPRFGLVAGLASCMRGGGAGFYARQGWCNEIRTHDLVSYTEGVSVICRQIC